MTDKSQVLEKTFFWILLAVLLLVFFWLLSPFFSAILFSLILALTFEPFHLWLLKVFKQNRYLSAFACMVLVFLFLALPVGAIVAAISNQLLKLAHTFEWNPDYLKNILGQGLIASLLQRWQETLGIEFDIGNSLKELLQNGAHTLYQFSPRVVAKTANFFLKGFVTLLLTYFFLVDGPKLYHFILDLSPLKESDEKLLSREIQVTLRACIYGYILTALVQAILATLGFYIAGIPIALLLGVATFIMCFVPIIGSAAIWIPVFIYFLATASYGKAIFMGIYGFFGISGIDNILKPILIGEKTKIHTVLLFLSIFGGLKLWGPVGILAGPTLVAVLLATLKIYRQDFR